MIKQSILLSCFIAGLALAQTDTPPCHVEVTIDGFQGGECKFIGVYGDQSFMALPAFTVSGPTIVVTKDEPFPSGLYSLVLPEEQGLQILLDVDQQFSIHTSLDDLTGAATVTGSLDNKLLYENLAYETSYQETVDLVFEKINELRKTDADADVSELQEQRNTLVAKRHSHIYQFCAQHPESFFSSYKISGQNPLLEYPKMANGELDVEEQTRLYREGYWDNFDFTDARLLRTPVFHNKLDRYIKKLTPRNVEAVIESVDKVMAKVKMNDELFSYVTSYLCLGYSKSTIMGGESVYVHVVDKYMTNELAASVPREELRKLRQRANKLRPSLLGKTAQNIKCIDPDGNDLALYDLKAPIVALYMYNVDCEHCQEITPELNDIYLRWKDRGFEVYALCLNIDVDPWFDYIEQEGLTWHNAIDPRYESRHHLKYNVDITPELYVLDADHEIIGVNLKPSQLEEWFLEKRLGAGSTGP